MGYYGWLALWAAVIGGVFAFLWKQGHLARLANYVGETQEEMKKCQWPSREELWQTTTLVLVVTGLLGIFIMVVDYILLGIIRWVLRG